MPDDNHRRLPLDCELTLDDALNSAQGHCVPRDAFQTAFARLLYSTSTNQLLEMFPSRYGPDFGLWTLSGEL